MEPRNVERPPPFQPSNIELVAKDDSTISGVSVYSGRAEVTRIFKFKVQTGQNQITVNGLPSVLDQESLRVQGRGAATIHDVTISRIPRLPVPTTSPTLTALQAKKERIVMALARCKKGIASLETYLATLHVQYIDVTQLRKVVKEYDATAEELDNQRLELQKELADVDKKLEDERTKLAGTGFDEKLNLRAVIGVFADSESEVEITLIYAVHGASWNAGYDIRVDMQAKEEPVTLIYKAGITQNTGEDWGDISLTLETATPTFGVGVPALDPWNLSIYKPEPIMLASQAAPPPPRWSMAPRAGRGGFGKSALVPHEATYAESYREPSIIAHRELEVSSKGNVSATFQVPGLISIPSDGVAHNVTIVQLKLNAKMSWVCVPKKDTKTHLSAKIKNASQYTLLRGTASVYMDGSFISRSEVPAVSPDESFDCALGLDPSIRITYHPRVKKQSQSGFVTKTANHVFTQNITIFNTKSMAIDNVRIVDQIPVSEDAQIQVRLINPSLSSALITGSRDSATASMIEAVRKPVPISKGVTALWDGADEPEVDGETLGRNGKLNWVCSVPPQSKVNLVLQWEVVVPARTDILGLALAVCYP
ncbi:Protein F37C4.5 [Hypsizygus marmoreus]|uniref:Protein F37C4.5 n=1 Tax=Hypsizygus marmoreus TaxID=39966 RepID=A0A369J247_HYPMA|nr:Protein F37C4.5 [Hypsizygus marmoreus]